MSRLRCTFHLTLRIKQQSFEITAVRIEYKRYSSCVLKVMNAATTASVSSISRSHVQ